MTINLKDTSSIFSESNGQGRQRFSIFTESMNRKSTTEDSMFGSMAESVGKMSIVDHFSTTFEYRTSLVRNMHQKWKPNGAKEDDMDEEEPEMEEVRESGGIETNRGLDRGASADSSLHARLSSTVVEGHSGDQIVVKYLEVTASQSRSEKRHSEGASGCRAGGDEEFKASEDGDPVEVVVIKDNNVAKNNFNCTYTSGSGRMLPGIRSFIQETSDAADPFGES